VVFRSAVTKSTQRDVVDGRVHAKCNKSDTAFIKEINVLTGSALAICNPLCHYTKLPLGPEAIACSDTLLQSKRFESPAATAEPEAVAVSAKEALILHWQSGVLALVLASPCISLFPFANL